MSKKVEMTYDAGLKRTLSALTDAGLLLVAQGGDGKPNPMTIGWTTIGSIWGLPMCVVLVRPSRYTYGLLNENGDFTVNVMPDDMTDVLNYCGTVSGRDYDKFAEKGLTAVPGLQANAPIVGESVIAYECRTVLTNEVLPDRLDSSIKDSSYPGGDFHRVYFGKILCVRGEAELP